MMKSLLAAMLVMAVAGSGCSVKRMAVNKVGDALAGGGTTFASDDDPELVKAAVPFSLKLMESLLNESPRHEGLLLATASGFTQYAYAFVQEDADEMEDKDLAAAEEMRGRARRLYLRARNYGLRGLEVRHKGFEKALRADAENGRERGHGEGCAAALLDGAFLGGGHLAVEGQSRFDRRDADGRGDDGSRAGFG